MFKWYEVSEKLPKMSCQCFFKIGTENTVYYGSFQEDSGLFFIRGTNRKTDGISSVTSWSYGECDPTDEFSEDCPKCSNRIRDCFTIAKTTLLLKEKVDSLSSGMQKIASLSNPFRSYHDEREPEFDKLNETLNSLIKKYQHRKRQEIIKRTKSSKPAMVPQPGSN